VLADVVEFVGEHGGFEARDPAHAPLGVGELAQQGPFQGGGGLELVLEFGDEDVEVVAVFAGQDRGLGAGLGAQAVFTGVLG
jgi:hypothetical protein